MISRLNVGGPAIQAITLTRRLEPLGYRTTLVRGREAPREGTMDGLAEELDVHPVLVPSLRRDPGLHDARALAALVKACRATNPHLVHTHAAKAGALGRAAALLASPRRPPVLVHTFHGHSLTGYFSSRAAAFYLGIERILARSTARLVAISPEVRDELVGLGVAGAERFEVIPLGFDLSGFLAGDDERRAHRARVRAELGIPPDAPVVTLVARLVPIKRVDRFLRVARMLTHRPEVRFLIVGDGELHDELRACADARALGDRLVWAGLRLDMPAVYFASDVVVITSDNEGTPVSLVEAQAAGVPVASTAVGGVRSVVSEGTGARLADPEDERGLRDGVEQLLDDLAGATEAARSRQQEVAARFSLDRLVSDVDALYRQLLSDRRS